MRRIQINKRIFFEYSIKGQFEEFNVTIPLYNKYFADLDTIDLEGKLIEDKFGNVSVIYDLQKPKRTFIKYFCNVQPKEIPDSIFVPAKDIFDVFEVPNYLKIEEISQKALKSVKKIEELKLFLRDNFKFDKCEYAAKTVILFADKKRLKTAALSGFLDNHHDSREIISITDSGKKFKFQNNHQHQWTLIKTSEGIEICDPKVIPGKETRFVERINVNNPIIVNWRIEGEQSSAQIKSHIYTIFIWR